MSFLEDSATISDTENIENISISATGRDRSDSAVEGFEDILENPFRILSDPETSLSNNLDIRRSRDSLKGSREDTIYSAMNRGRAGSGPRAGSSESNKNQGNDNQWREPHHTMVKSDSESELSDSEHFLTKGAFLLTPSHDLTMERAAAVCEKMTFKGCFSLTKTATGILFKFSDYDDYQTVYRKGFHKVTNSRFYRKVIIPCRPQKTFSVYVFDVPDDLPEEDIRHCLYKFTSIVEVVRLQLTSNNQVSTTQKTVRRTSLADDEPSRPNQSSANVSNALVPAPPPPSACSAIRVTLASIEECNILLQNGLDFYGATFFPTELATPSQAAKLVKPNRVIGGSISARVRDLLPVFDNSGFTKLPPPAMKMIKPRVK